MHSAHKAILSLIRKHSGKPTSHTFSDTYLGTSHPRYPINAPTMRIIAKAWMRDHRDLTAAEFCSILTSLIGGVSATEKCMAGLLLDASRPAQRAFDPSVFIKWLDHLEGWAEIDTVCTGKYTISEIPGQWSKWKKILNTLSRSPNINKRRASLVLLCSPIRKVNDPRLVDTAFANIERLKHEKEVIITKAISWVLRCALTHHPMLVKKYLALNAQTLPKIAIRETLIKLKTGRKN